MHRVGSAGNTSNSSRPRKEKRLSYVLNNADSTKHCAGINCLAVSPSSAPIGGDYLFTGSRDGTVKRWDLGEDVATCSGTYESHVDWVNDVALAGDVLVSCSSDTTLKAWKCFSDGSCLRTFRQHSDYVICLAAPGKNSNIVASGGLGGEVFVWDLEAALVPITRSAEPLEDENSSRITGSGPVRNPLYITSGSSHCGHTVSSHSYLPTAAKGHKDSVYALAISDNGNVLVSGGTEKVVRMWDPRSGSKNMKLRGHTDNIRALLLDSTGRFCLSGASDSLIRLWDLGQQRCVHSYAVHTDSVWALVSTPSFSHVYSGGRDLSLYLTDLATRESILLCTEEQPILQMALQDESIWVATTDSSLKRWPVDGKSPHKVFQRGSSFLAGNLSFSRTRACLDGSTPVPVYKHPSMTIPGIPAIVQHEILNNRRQVLTKDAEGSVKLWEITRGIVLEDYGKDSFEKMKEKLQEMVSIPAWFTMDARFGCLAVHLDTPQCFSAEMYAVDMNIKGASEDYKINIAQETLRGLLAHWLSRRKQKSGIQVSSSDDIISPRKDNPAKSHLHSRLEATDLGDAHNYQVLPMFEFPVASPPSIITEGSHGGPWRKKITDLDGTEDEKDFPWWCLDCVLNGRLPQRENTKCSFSLRPCEGSTVQLLTQGKLSAPQILRIHKVVNYILEKMVIDKGLDGPSSDSQFTSGVAGQLQLPSSGDIAFRPGSKSWKLKPLIEILCNNQVLQPDMSLATVRAYIWKKPDDLVLNYRVLSGR